ncbi:tetratricopeptide repeat protein [Desulfovibrio sp. TomC]|uniref:tetratricopeptide repeat protein n=1 Tax=Desulfovibrio sp. TomC TaxID=1562888 RepID=UPI0009E303A4|nr:tetratricopeptide repeat protein [Desulfovibrio sp. TomC]
MVSIEYRILFLALSFTIFATASCAPTTFSQKFSETSAHEYFAKGVSLAQNRNFQEASFAFDKSIQLNPTFLPSYFLAASTQYSLNHYGSCAKYARDAIAIDSDYADAYDIGSECLYQHAKYSEAIPLLEHLITLKPGTAKKDFYQSPVDAYFRLGMCYLFLKNFDKSVIYFKKFLALAKNDNNFKDFVQFAEKAVGTFEKELKASSISVKEKNKHHINNVQRTSNNQSSSKVDAILVEANKIHDKTRVVY